MFDAAPRRLWFYPYGPRIVYVLAVALGVVAMSLYSFIQGRQAQQRADAFRAAAHCVTAGQETGGCAMEKATVLDAWYVIGRTRPPGIQVQRNSGTVENIYFPASNQSIIGVVSQGATVELQTWDGQVTQVRADGVEARPAQNPLADAEGWQLGARMGAYVTPFLVLIAGYLAVRQWLVYRALSGPWP